MITNSWSRLQLTDHGCAPIGWRDHWCQSATLGYYHGHHNRDHGGHHRDDEDVVWRRCRLDIVVATSLQLSRQPSSVVWDVVVDDDDRRHGRRPSLDVRHCRLSLSVVIVEIRHLVWGHAITISICPGVCVSVHSLSIWRPAMAIHLWGLSGQFCYVCPGVIVPASCNLLPVPWVWK